MTVPFDHIRFAGELAELITLDDTMHWPAAEPLAFTLSQLGGLSLRASSDAAGPHVVGQPCPLPAVEWHAQCFVEVAKRGIAGYRSPAKAQWKELAVEPWWVRLQYHARWLGTFFFPDYPLFALRTTVVIPVYNGADEVVQAAASCLAQTDFGVEVLVIDDGSRDDPAAALARLGDRVRIIRQSNSGVAVARTQGVRHARGEYVHFLDADDLLEPTAVAAKLAAFRAIADAELCYSLCSARGQNAVRDARTYFAPPLGDADCPTRDLLHTTTQRFAMHISTVMQPRWVALEVGPFDADLRQAQDSRYWFQHGFRGTKVIGVPEALTQRTFPLHSLTSAKQSESDEYRATAYLRNFADLVASPRHHAYLERSWRFAYLNLCRACLRRGLPLTLELVLAKLAESLRHLHREIDDEYRTATIDACRALRTHFAAARWLAPVSDRRLAACLAELAEAIESPCAALSIPPAKGDLVQQSRLALAAFGRQTLWRCEAWPAFRYLSDRLRASRARSKTAA